MHIERFGNTEVEGIELGEVYVFPKLDGTNASLWLEYEKGNFNISGGSRNRLVSVDNDNQGFMVAIMGDAEKYIPFFSDNPTYRLYGEWLVPHTLKTYREDAWRKFWIFDVYNDTTEQFIPYDEYKTILDNYGLDYIPPLAKIKNGTYENFVHVLGNNNFFIKDGEGTGEGIVLKNYSFYNKFGNQVWAKIITSEFKEQHHKEMGCPETSGKLIEEEIVDKFCTEALVQKVFANLQKLEEGWSSKMIPRLLETVYYDIIKEEMWEILKKHNNPTINFKTLKHLVISKTKQVLPEVF